MGSKWNYSGCCGQCAGCNHCGNTICDSAADCGAPCGLNTEELDNTAGCCGNTICCTDADDCAPCGLTINPDGSQLVSNQGSNYPRRRLRTAASSGNYRIRRNAAAAPHNVNDSSCGSDDCSCGNQSRSCGDGDDCGRPKGNRCGVKRNSGCNGACHSASVFHEVQELNETYAAEEALFQGTLFPELNKPMAARNCMTKNCATRRQLAAFEAWELRLYLDTHPEDPCALNRWKQLCREACKDNYATAFTGECDQGDCWQWINAPWPWEYQCCGSKRSCND